MIRLVLLKSACHGTGITRVSVWVPRLADVWCYCVYCLPCLCNKNAVVVALKFVSLLSSYDESAASYMGM